MIELGLGRYFFTYKHCLSVTNRIQVFWANHGSRDFQCAMFDDQGDQGTQMLGMFTFVVILWVHCYPILGMMDYLTDLTGLPKKGTQQDVFPSKTGDVVRSCALLKMSRDFRATARLVQV